MRDCPWGRPSWGSPPARSGDWRDARVLTKPRCWDVPGAGSLLDIERGQRVERPGAVVRVVVHDGCLLALSCAVVLEHVHAVPTAQNAQLVDEHPRSAILKDCQHPRVLSGGEGGGIKVLSRERLCVGRDWLELVGRKTVSQVIWRECGGVTLSFGVLCSHGRLTFGGPWGRNNRAQTAGLLMLLL